MNKHMKKAFTITELVIVIAVIAILAAVLIPTFANVLNKANVSNDTAMARHMNEFLVMGSTTSKPQWASEAAEILAEEGIDLGKFTPSTEGYRYAWHKPSNQVLLLDENLKVLYPEIEADPADIFLMVNKTDDMVDGYALMIADGDITVDESNLTLDVAHETLAVTIATEQTATFTVHTNGGALTIDAVKADVHRYGEAGSVTVQAGNSYHEYGKTTALSVKQCHVELESTAVVDMFTVLSGGTTTVTKNESAEVKVAVADEGSDLSGLDGITVKKKTEVSTVEEFKAALANSEDEVIYLKKNIYAVEELTINRSVALIGEQGAVIEQNSSAQDFIKVTDKSAACEFSMIGLTVQNASTDNNNETAISIGLPGALFAGNAYISNCTFSGFTKNGIEANGGNVAIENNNIYNGTFENQAGNAIQIDNGAIAVINNNYIYGYVEQSQNWTATGIIVFYGSSINEIKGNTIVSCTHAIELSTYYDDKGLNTFLASHAETENKFTDCVEDVYRTAKYWSDAEMEELKKNPTLDEIYDGNSDGYYGYPSHGWVKENGSWVEYDLASGN